jgi:lactoylglutathione lyase
VTGPAGEKWEVYTVLADSDTFGTSPQHESAEADEMCCGNAQAEADGDKVRAGSACC